MKQFAHQQQYDVVLFKGVFYHLPDPIDTLAKLCDLTGRAIIIDSASRSDIPGDCMVPWWESTTHVMSGVDGLAWFPGGPEVIGAILKWRDTMGATDPQKAAPGTIRHDLGTSIGNNVTHGSDAPETAAFEIGYFFSGLELI